jgi:hypothetical protein
MRARMAEARTSTTSARAGIDDDVPLVPVWFVITRATYRSAKRDAGIVERTRWRELAPSLPSLEPVFDSNLIGSGHTNSANEGSCPEVGLTLRNLTNTEEP